MLTYGYTSTGSPHAGSYAGRGGDGSPLHQALLLKKERFFKALPFIGSCFVNITSNTVIVSQTIKKIGRAGQTRTFSRFCDSAVKDANAKDAKCHRREILFLASTK